MKALADKLLNPEILSCQCGKTPILKNTYISSEKHKHFIVYCERCSNQGMEHLEAWLAILNWNKSKLSIYI